MYFFFFNLDKTDSSYKQSQDDRLTEIHWDILSLLKNDNEIDSHLRLIRDGQRRIFSVCVGGQRK
jgi:hypothetical protein